MTLAEEAPTQADDPLQHAQKRIHDQKLVVEKLKAAGEDSEVAERLLATYRELLRALVE